MCKLITIDFNTRKHASTELKPKRRGTIEVIPAAEEFRKTHTDAMRGDLDYECRQDAAAALLDMNADEVTWRDIMWLAKLRPPSDDAVTIEGLVPVEVRRKMNAIAMGAGWMGEVMDGFVFFEATMPQRIALRALEVAHKAGVRIQSEYSSIRKRFSSFLKISHVKGKGKTCARKPLSDLRHAG